MDRDKSPFDKGNIVLSKEQFILNEIKVGDTWRMFRIMAEFVEGFEQLAGLAPAVTVFGSARAKESDFRYQTARRLGKIMAEKGIAVVTGGGPGIMEAANRGAIKGGGQSIGMNISLPFEQFANAYISPGLDFEFHYFFMRKFWFAYLAKALVIFPGGFGTLDELMEILTLRQTKKITKPVSVVMYGSEYWNKVLDFKELVNHGMVDRADLDLFTVIDTPREAFQHLRRFLTEQYLQKTSGAPG